MLSKLFNFSDKNFFGLRKGPIPLGEWAIGIRNYVAPPPGGARFDPKSRLFDYGALKELQMTRIALVLTMVLLGGCASKRTFTGESASVTTNSFIDIQALWLKDKGKKYDLELNVRNISEQPVILLLSEMSCQKGGQTGILRHTFFNTGERTIDFRAGEMKRFKMVCDVGTDAKGDHKITVGQVYANPEGDGRTKGPVLASDIVWTGKSQR
jgi:hypothetical protein